MLPYSVKKLFTAVSIAVADAKAVIFRAFWMAALPAAKPAAASTAMIEITTRSSTSVKPCVAAGSWDFHVGGRMGFQNRGANTNFRANQNESPKIRIHMVNT